MTNNIQNLIDELMVEYGVNKDVLLDIILKAIEEAWITDAGEGYIIGMEMQKSKYGNAMKYYRVLEVVNEVEVPQRQISLEEARFLKPDVQLLDTIKMDIDLSSLSRNSMQQAHKYIKKHLFYKKKQNEFEYFSDKVGTIVSGVIKAKSSQGIIVDFYGFEGIITDYKSYQFSQNDFISGSKIKSYVYKLEENVEGFQVFLSRNNQEFLLELLKEEIPEIKNDLIQIMGIARNPGFASIVLVQSEDRFNKINPISICVGNEGIRIKNIQKELHGEKISIVLWKEMLFARIATVLNHKTKVTIKKIILHDNEESDSYVEVMIPQEQISKLIGVRGRNIDLISRALGIKLKIVSYEQYLINNQGFASALGDKERIELVNQFVTLLEINEEDADTLISSGCVSVDDIVKMTFNNFLLINLVSNNHGAVYNRALANSIKSNEYPEETVNTEVEDGDYDEDEDE